MIVEVCVSVWNSGTLLDGIASCSASDYASTYIFLRSAVCLYVCRVSHSCTLLKLFDEFRCHLAGTLVGSNEKLC